MRFLSEPTRKKQKPTTAYRDRLSLSLDKAGVLRRPGTDKVRLSLSLDKAGHLVRSPSCVLRLLKKAQAGNLAGDLKRSAGILRTPGTRKAIFARFTAT